MATDHGLPVGPGPATRRCIAARSSSGTQLSAPTSSGSATHIWTREDEWPMRVTFAQRVSRATRMLSGGLACCQAR